MTIHGCCPKCGSEIAHDRFVNGQAICKCGWFDDRSVREAILKAERKTILTMVVASFVIALGFGHIANWGTAALTVPLAKVQMITGTLSEKGFDDLAESCLTRAKYECAIGAYQEKFKATKKTEALAQLAKLNLQLGQNAKAMAAYANYFKLNGTNTEAAYLYGRLLEGAENFDEAMRMYELAAAQTDETLPVLSTGAAVRLFMKLGRYEEAYARIQKFHESSEQAKGYLNTELTQLETRLSVTKPKRSSRST